MPLRSILFSCLSAKPVRMIARGRGSDSQPGKLYISVTYASDYLIFTDYIMRAGFCQQKSVIRAFSAPKSLKSPSFSAKIIRQMRTWPNGMASASQAEGCGFEPRRPLQTEDKGASCALSSYCGLRSFPSRQTLSPSLLKERSLQPFCSSGGSISHETRNAQPDGCAFLLCNQVANR